MSLRHALLALLTARPLTGYEIWKYFDGSAQYVWNAVHSQIYTELRRLQADELVDAVDQPWGTSATKTTYSITESGELEFRRWMNTPLPYPKTKEPHYLKAAYFEWATDESVRDQLRRHRDHYLLQAQTYRLVLGSFDPPQHPLLVSRLKPMTAAERRRVIAFKIQAYKGLLRRAEVEVEWAEESLAVVDDLERDRWNSSP